MRATCFLAMLVLGYAVLATAAVHADSPPECAGQAATIVGTDGGDKIAGTDGTDVIVSLAGNDVIASGAGVDLICAGPEATELLDNDRILSGDGDDFVLSGGGDDVVVLGAGLDYAGAGSGLDDVRGGDGEDFIDTGTQPDDADGGAGRDFLTTGDGEDSIGSSGGGEDYLDGGPGGDAIVGGPQTEYIDGGDGPDRIVSPSGHIEAGSGSDTVNAKGSVSFVEGGEGADVIQSPGYLEGGPGDDALTSLPAGNAYLDGGEGADVLIGRGPANTLDGGAGEDRLDGGTDSLLLGGLGNDVLKAGSGTDRIQAGDGDDELRGGAGPDVLAGEGGSDVLIGGPDPDEFLAGSGTDILRGVDDTPDTVFDCGPEFEADRLVLDTVADADVPRFSCDATAPRVYSPPPTPAPVGFRYVALGDSFSSGEGTNAYDDFFGYCHRGPLAWPRYLGRRHLGLSDIDHRACTGARTTHVLNPWSDKLQDPQIHAKKQTRTELVTITIGGNDIGFAELLTKVRISANDGPPSPTIGRAGTEREIQGKLRTLRASLQPIYRQLRQKYPNARIVHVGYPRILPSVDEPRPHRCEWLGKKERDLADWILNELNGTIRGTADASAHDIDYVDVSEALDGHELCTGEPWVNDLAVEFADIPGDSIGGSTERGHPNLEGQIAYADAVAAGL